MFNKLKQIKDMREKAKSIQAQLAEEVVENTTKGITIKMDGNQKVLAVSISDEMMGNKEKLEKNMADAMNETVKKVQKAMATKMQQSGDLDLPGLG